MLLSSLSSERFPTCVKSIIVYEVDMGDLSCAEREGDSTHVLEGLTWSTVVSNAWRADTAVGAREELCRVLSVFEMVKSHNVSLTNEHLPL